MENVVFVTGGAGFIGSALIRELHQNTEFEIVNIDALTYAASPEAVSDVTGSDRYHFEHVDIRNRDRLGTLFREYQPRAVLHLAAESHVDRSIDGAEDFVTTNVLGSFRLLEAARGYWQDLPSDAKAEFRFHHVSTDEVYGSLNDGGVFHAESTYSPNSPYAASKASADHFVRAWHETYGLPVIVTNSSNNYGPYQHPEKLIPRVITTAVTDSAIPVYGDGTNVRDWLYVEDHACALRTVLGRGEIGETYLIGAREEHQNIEIVEKICALLDEKIPRSDGASYRRQISFVEDRPGHDQRYAIDPTKLEEELNWSAREPFENALEETVEWYLEHSQWWRECLSESEGAERLGVIE